MVEKKRQFTLVGCGGTFDRLHLGHQAFLEKAFSLGRRVLIGVTTDQMAKTKLFPSLILPFANRVEELKVFFKKKGWNQRAAIIAISDIYGPARTDESIEAVVVTKKTRPNAIKINQQRKKHGLAPLAIVEIGFITGIDGEPIASRWIRAGIQDRLGRVFTSAKLALAPCFISPRQRRKLKAPLGKFFPREGHRLELVAKEAVSHLPKNCPLLVTVGDVATLSLVKLNLKPQLAIIDLYVQRHQVYDDIAELGLPAQTKVVVVSNPRGGISKELFAAVAKAMGQLRARILDRPASWRDPNSSRMIAIRVVGEEDLAALPAILLAPLSSVVIYGQPSMQQVGRQGLVVVEVTEEKKKEVLKIWGRG